MMSMRKVKGFTLIELLVAYYEERFSISMLKDIKYHGGFMTR
jgi:Tfp pilus assembly protein PilE